MVDYSPIPMDDSLPPSPSAPFRTPTPSPTRPYSHSNPRTYSQSYHINPPVCTLRRVWYSISFFGLIVAFWIAAQMYQTESQAGTAEERSQMHQKQLSYVFGVLYFSFAGFGIGGLLFECFPRIVPRLFPRTRECCHFLNP
jgi:hypothetical protein